MSKRLTIAGILSRCAAMDARLSGLSAYSLSVFEYPDGNAPGFPLGQVVYTKTAGSKVVAVGKGYQVALSIRFLPSSVGPAGSQYYPLGSGWVLRVDADDQVERVGREECTLCGADLHSYAWDVTACAACRYD